MRTIGLITTAALCAVPALGQNNIPVRRLGPVTGTDSGVITLAMGVRALPGGRALVNDFVRKRLVVLDSTMKVMTTVADTAAGAPYPYWEHGGALLPFLADSSVFADQSGALTVIDPAGHVGRALAPPKASDVRLLLGGAAVGPPQGFDPLGRLVYRTNRATARPRVLATPVDSGVVTVTIGRDSAAIVRGDPDTRTVDTIGYLALPVSKTVMTSLGRGRSTGGGAVDPLQSSDQWALLPDGTVAIVRTADYHIDWITPDGKMTSTPKMAFDWKRVTDEDKQRMIDSARKEFDTRRAAMPPPAPQPPPGAGGTVSYSSPAPSLQMTFVAVDPSDMPDYYPPIRPSSVHADRDGNVWILPTTSVLAGRGLVFDVINRKGEIVERVQIPEGRNIVAFGAGGIVYMVSQVGPRTQRLEWARVAR